MSQSTAQKVALELFDIGAVRFDGPFRFKVHEKYPNFPLSPNKIELRTPENGGRLTPQLVSAIGWELYKKAKLSHVMFDLVVGLPKAGEPFAEVVVRCSHKPLLKLSKVVKPSQRYLGEIISGDYEQGQPVLVIDDVVSQAFTKLEAIAQLERAGLQIATILVVVDREEGGSEYLQELGYRFLCVYEFSTMLRLYYRLGKISREKLEESLAYSDKARRFFFRNLD